MPSEFTHVFVSGALGKACMDGRMPLRFWGIAAVCSVLPDVDVVGYYLGVRYAGLFGHRGVTHSLFFALLVGLLVTALVFPALERYSKRWWAFVLFFFAVTASHGLLDAMTDKGLGVGFFIPFDETRYFLPWRPIEASPMRISRFFSRMGVEVLANEIIWIWTPVLLLTIAVRFLRRRFASSSP